MDNQSVEKKIILEGDFEDVIELKDHYYLVDKKDRICVLPYTISSEGLLDKIGVIKSWNYLEEKETLTLMTDYLNTDDSTDLVCANRILFEIIGSNVDEAVNWMFLGNIHNSIGSESPIKIYAVDISETEIKTMEDVEEEEERKKFKMLDSSKVIQSDDMIFLASYLRLFNYFYINSLEKE